MKLWMIEKRRSNGGWSPLGLGDAHLSACMPFSTPQEAEEWRGDLWRRGYFKITELRVSLFVRAQGTNERRRVARKKKQR